MIRKSRSMRALLVVALILAVGGCSSARQALGLYKRTADKGVTLGGGRPDSGVAPPGSAGSETAAAPTESRAAEARATKPVLPAGLGGDKEHRAYTTDVPK